MYECGGCGKLFKTTRWLSRHQKTCKPRKALLEAGSWKFQKAHSTPKTSGNLLSKFNSLIFGHGRSGSSREQLVGSSSGTQPELDNEEPPAASDPDVIMTDLIPPEITEMDFVSHLRSLAAEESELIRSSETSTASVRRGTHIKQPTWKVHENQLAEASHQEPPLPATNIVPPAFRSPSPQPPSYQPLQSVIDRFGLLRFYPVSSSGVGRW